MIKPKKTIGTNPLAAYLSVAIHEEKPAQTFSTDNDTLGSQVFEVHNEEELSNENSSQPEISTTPAQQLSTQELMLQQADVITQKQRITLHIPSDLIERVKNAVYWEPGLTLAGFAEYALAQALEQVEQDRGAPFPQRRKHLRSGRPMK